MTTGRINQVANRSAVRRVPFGGDHVGLSCVATKQHGLRTLRFAYGQTTRQLVVGCNRPPLPAAAPYPTTNFCTLSPIPLRAVNFETVGMIQALHDEPTRSLNVSRSRRYRRRGRFQAVPTPRRPGDLRQQPSANNNSRTRRRIEL